ncbi:MAG: hypothetical protein AAFN70_12360, partial [Planctomycetota bacterium]
MFFDNRRSRSNNRRNGTTNPKKGFAASRRNASTRRKRTRLFQQLETRNLLATDVWINKIHYDNDGGDTGEGIEIAGPAGTNLIGLWRELYNGSNGSLYDTENLTGTLTYLVIGDGTAAEGSGVIEAVVPLSSATIPADGYLLVGETGRGDVLGETADLLAALNFEGSDNVTHLIVQGFMNADGDDLDTNDDGTLDVMPWTSIIDSVALLETNDGTGDLVYSGTTVGPNGTTLLVANEGEPDGGTNPDGSVSVVEISSGVGSATVTTIAIDVRATKQFEIDNLANSYTKITPGVQPSADFEPEFITVSPDGSIAFVTLQENNAVAVLDLSVNSVSKILPLGYKDNLATNAATDATNNSPDSFALENLPVRGLFQPDVLASYSFGGTNFFVTANEGDARDPEETEIQNVTLNPTVFTDAATLQDPDNAGELEITSLFGAPDDNGDFDALYSFGDRSFSIFDDSGQLVFDSGDLLARAADAA